MNTLSYKTQSAKKVEVDRKWHIIDADGEIIGRMSTRIADILRGKHKASYTPHVVTGDFVIIINADKARFTGAKMDNKTYQRYSGYPGGQKSRTAKEQMAKRPEFILEHAIKGMLPKNKLSSKIFNKLFVYTGTDHPHGAQKPVELKLD